MRPFLISLRLIFTLLLVTTLAACGSGGGEGVSAASPKASTYSIGGSISGLANNAQVVIRNNGSDLLTLNGNGTFTFGTQVAYSGQYGITISSQPVGQICSVANGTGSGSGVTVNITNISIICSADTYTIGGNITGLASGTQFILQNNGDNKLVLNSNGTFIFSTPVAYDGSYAVTVSDQPVGQVCSVANNTGSGAGIIANINTINITCSSSSFNVGGSISGLISGSQVTLENNGTNPLIVDSDGSFTFPAAVAYNGSYNVTVSGYPVGQICSLANGTGSGSGVTADVHGISIICSSDLYTIGGTISGLASGSQVTLQNNGNDILLLNANGTFNFKTLVAYRGSYSVQVNSQPAGQICSVASGTGAGVDINANVSNISITCSTDTYTIGGNLSGLASGAQVTLQNNGADPLTLTANGNFTFTTPVANNGSYVVTISTQPNGEICSVSGNTGAGVTANVNNLSIVCSLSSYSVGGNISGLASGMQLTLQNNGNALVLSTNGTFTFPTLIGYNGSYSVRISSQPVGQICTLSNNSGSGMVANISNIEITCTPTPSPAVALVAKLGKPNRLLVGLGAGNSVTTMNAQGIKPDIIDTYLVGVGSGSWIGYNSPSGSYLTDVTQTADAVSAIPMFTLYQMAQNGDGNLSGLSDSTFMNNYWSQVRLMFQLLGNYNKPALVNLEPDFWGYVELQATNANPTQMVAVVNTQSECSQLPNNAIGLAQCMLVMARTYAPKTLVGYPASFFGESATTVANFMQKVGAQNADFIVAQTSDRDAGCMEVASPLPECSGRGSGPFYWDEANIKSPNYTQSLATWSNYRSNLGNNLPILWWQTPMGVPSTTPGGTNQHYRDNHVHYMLNYPSQYTTIGTVGIVFSSGASSQTTIATDGGQFQNLFSQYLTAGGSPLK